MPKQLLTKMQLPPAKPDRCADCPLCGVIPKEERKERSKYSHVCLGTATALTGRGIKVRASKRDKNHRLRRPCDELWGAWQTLPAARLAISTESYIHYRVPYERSGQLTIRYPKS